MSRKGKGVSVKSDFLSTVSSDKLALAEKPARMLQITVITTVISEITVKLITAVCKISSQSINVPIALFFGVFFDRT